jgi:hypothetical protein
MKARTVTFLKEHFAILFALISFFVYPYVIRWFDPTAATYDAGVLQIIVITIIMFTIFQWAVWRVINALWPVLAEFAKKLFNEYFKELTPWQQIKTFLSVYFGLFAALVALSRVIS